MSAIGPGDWVQRVREDLSRITTAGAFYQVQAIFPSNGCIVCNTRIGFLKLRDKPLIGAGGYALCPCGFRPWPPEANASLLSETDEVPADPVTA